MADIIRELEKEQLRTDLPKLEVGDRALAAGQGH